MWPQMDMGWLAARFTDMNRNFLSCSLTDRDSSTDKLEGRGMFLNVT